MNQVALGVKVTATTGLSKLPRFFSVLLPQTGTSHEIHQIHSSSSSPLLLHSKTIKSGYSQHLNTSNHLLSLYTKRSPNLDSARKLFDEMPIRDVRSWTFLITAFARAGSSKMALQLFIEMQMEGVYPNQFTLSCVVKCVESVQTGREIHAWILRNGVGLDTVLENSILHFYVKCRELHYARSVFWSMGDKDIVSYNILIDGCVQNGDTDAALELFRGMPCKDAASWNTIIVGLMRNGCDVAAMELLYEMSASGIVFTEVSLSIALSMAASLEILKLGRQVHTKVLKFGLGDDRFLRSSLINMYCKCGQVDKASDIFGGKPWGSPEILCFGSSEETAVFWSSMISGEVQNGRTEEALKMFRRMVFEGVQVDQFTLTSIVSACANVGIAEQGSQIHALITKLGHKLDDVSVSAIIDMYAKCGKLHDALSMFYQSNSRNIVLWTSVINGCALHGQGKEAICLFQLMLKEGIRPNKISFLGVLSGCSHAGLVEEGRVYFKSMQENYGIVPELEHFTCMVDLLGRAGCLDDAKDFIYQNGISDQSAVWRAFLSACRVHQNIELGKLASNQLLELEPLTAGSYVLLSNICTTTDRWNEAAETRSLMQRRGVKKHPGQSWIHLKNRVHTFVVGDRSHPQAADIYSFLERLIGRLKEVGYSSDTNFAMHDVEEEQKEVLLGFHSEKLAIAYGIMCTPHGSPIIVMKNLRVCVDCHTVIKYISQVTGRELTVRDSRRFHHFKQGCCSCGDYW